MGKRKKLEHINVTLMIRLIYGERKLHRGLLIAALQHSQRPTLFSFLPSPQKQQYYYSIVYTYVLPIALRHVTHWSENRSKKNKLEMKKKRFQVQRGNYDLKKWQVRSGLSTWKYQFSYDHWSQATLSLVSTSVGDCSSVVWVLLITPKGRACVRDSQRAKV